MFLKVNSLSNEISDLKTAMSAGIEKETEESKLAGIEEQTTTDTYKETESDEPVYVRPIETRPAETDKNSEQDEENMSEKERVGANLVLFKFEWVSNTY